MVLGSPGRVIEVEWGRPGGDKSALYALEVLVEAADRPGLLRDISEVFAKDKMNVTGVQTASAKARARDHGTARMSFTVEVTDTARLAPVLNQIMRLAGVRHARRK